MSGASFPQRLASTSRCERSTTEIESIWTHPSRSMQATIWSRAARRPRDAETLRPDRMAPSGCERDPLTSSRSSKLGVGEPLEHVGAREHADGRGAVGDEHGRADCRSR